MRYCAKHADTALHAAVRFHDKCHERSFRGNMGVCRNHPALLRRKIQVITCAAGTEDFQERGCSVLAEGVWSLTQGMFVACFFPLQICLMDRKRKTLDGMPLHLCTSMRDRPQEGAVRPSHQHVARQLAGGVLSQELSAFVAKGFILFCSVQNFLQVETHRIHFR